MLTSHLSLASAVISGIIQAKVRLAPGANLNNIFLLKALFIKLAYQLPKVFILVDLAILNCLM